MTSAAPAIPAAPGLRPGEVRTVAVEGEVPLGPEVTRVLLAVELAGALPGATLELAARRRGGFGAWLSVLGSGPRAGGGDAVEVDQLLLGSPADGLRVRSRGLASVSIGAAGSTPALGRAGAEPSIGLTVAFLTQRSLPEPIAGRACCPTSLAMVLGFHGVGRPLPGVAEAVRDPDRGIYGNWLRASAVAAAHGCPAQVRQARSWAQVAGWLRERGPVIASIACEEGELPGAVMPRTDGHLVVITGFDGRGGVVVHDPAGPAGANLVLDADAFGRAWAGHGAVAIVVSAPRTVA